MAKEVVSVLTSIDFIATKMLYLRGEKVLLDSDLALLYGIETRVLKQSVRRNIARFPDDFLFELTREGMGSSKITKCDLRKR